MALLLSQTLGQCEHSGVLHCDRRLSPARMMDPMTHDYTWTHVAMLAVGMSPLLLCVLLFFAALVRIQWNE